MTDRKYKIHLRASAVLLAVSLTASVFGAAMLLSITRQDAGIGAYTTYESCMEDARLYEKRGEYEKAIVCYERALEKQPGSTRAKEAIESCMEHVR